MDEPEVFDNYIPSETFTYRLKRLFLGQPLVSEKLSGEKLGKGIALAILSSDVMSSCAYATEQILIVLIMAVGIGAYSLVVPVTIGILFVLLAVTLSYLQVIPAYPKAGGAYVVSRDNFGNSIAQIASAALLIDYTLTVAVSVASGVDALASAVTVLQNYKTELSVLFVLLIAYGNLRGIREAGKAFSIPTFIFIANLYLLIVVGVYKWINGSLITQSMHQSGSVSIGHAGSGLMMGASFFIIAAAYDNGGTALTGTEAISNGVSVFKTRYKFGNKIIDGINGQVKNAKVTLMSMSLILGSMFFGISLLASKIHPIPRISETPTVVAQIADVVYGHTAFGHLLYLVLQFSTMAILVLAANTSFTGFPLLASFAAEDSFLPRQLTKRGHRLVFSNGIMVLTVVSVALLIATNAQVSSLIALYAIGVFTGFTMAGAGMVKHHLTYKEKGYKRKIAINGSSAVLCLFVDLMFIVTKFTEGAWLVVVLMPIMVISFIYLHKQYQEETKVLEQDAQVLCEAPTTKKHIVIVLIERLDVATARAIQYARSLDPDELRAVHFILDPLESHVLEDSWMKLGLSQLTLDLVECPDRRLGKAVVALLSDLLLGGDTEVSVLLPRRVYVGSLRRVLHDRTAERVSALVSVIPNASATVIPYRLTKSGRRIKLHAFGHKSRSIADKEMEKEQVSIANVKGSVKIDSIQPRTRVKVAGRIISVRVQPRAGVPSLECVLSDLTGKVVLQFQGRRTIPGISPGVRLVAQGTVIKKGPQLIILNPTYELHSEVETQV
jgi:amino acid transporter